MGHRVFGCRGARQSRAHQRSPAWAHIQRQTALTLADLDRADLVGEQLVNAVGTRRQGSVVTAEVTPIRQRLFTLFADAWDQVRRAISYLRWNEDDVDDIAPSLYAGRARRKTDVPANPPEPPAPPTGTAAKTVTPATKTQTAPAEATSPAAPPAPGAATSKPNVANGSPAGTPGSSPFVP